MKKQDQTVKNSNWKVFSIVSIIVIVAALFVWYNASRQEDPDVMTVKACLISHEFMNDRLKAPGSAEYESCYPPHETTTTLGENNYFVKSYVDSENSFGAMLRTEYTMTLHYEGNDHWTMRELSTS